MGSRAGVEKTVAARAGISVEGYRARRAAGLKRCVGCREWKPEASFGSDSTRGDGRDATCRVCRSARGVATYEPRPRPKGRRYVAPRSGDALQARGRVNHLVRVRILADPNDVPCKDCGHRVGDGIRHEYDHFLGYAAEHHEHVQAVCAPCHHAREARRGGARRERGARGRFAWRA